jgi:flagellar basal-body rod protein FlgC
MRIENLAAIASSGMRLESQRLAQSAANTANVETPGYEARRIVAASRSGGGVIGTSVPTYGPRGVRMEADGGVTQLSNTDPIDETVTQLSSVRAFQANVAVLRTADEMIGELLDRRA